MLSCQIFYSSEDIKQLSLLITVYTNHDAIKFKIYLGSSFEASWAMADRELKDGKKEIQKFEYL